MDYKRFACRPLLDGLPESSRPLVEHPPTKPHPQKYRRPPGHVHWVVNQTLRERHGYLEDYTISFWSVPALSNPPLAERLPSQLGEAGPGNLTPSDRAILSP